MPENTAVKTGAAAGAGALQLLTIYWAVSGTMSAGALVAVGILLALLGGTLGALAGWGLRGSVIAAAEQTPQVDGYEQRLAA